MRWPLFLSLLVAQGACSDDSGGADGATDAATGGATDSATDTSRSPRDTSTPPRDARPPMPDGSATLGCTLAWSSGFETGFPGEWLDYDNGSWSVDGTLPSGRVSAWTIVDASTGPVFEGDYSYMGWVTAPAAESHRPYPVVHTDIPTPVVNTWYVFQEADYDALGSSEWIHFGTWGNGDADRWALHTMSVRDRKVEFAHVEPFTGEYVGPEPQPDFPLGQWVRFTVYAHYRDGNGEVYAWQDGVLILRADIPDLAMFPGLNLQRAHWGMYASAGTGGGTQYNDDIRVWSLSAPLTDFSVEPDCYLD